MGQADIRQLVRLKRGDRVKFTMTLPVFADNESFSFRLRENGRFVNGFTSHVGFQSGRAMSESPVLVAANSSSSLGLMTAGWLRAMQPRLASAGTTVPGPAPSSPRMDYMLDPERLPTNWLGFTSLRAVLLGPQEWKQLDPAQQDAVLFWTASGGDLLFLDGAAEMLLPPGQRPVGLGGTESVLPYYLGNIHLVKSADIAAKGFEPVIRDLGDQVATPDWSLPQFDPETGDGSATEAFGCPLTEPATSLPGPICRYLPSSSL
jgi:hypothetical protein